VWPRASPEINGTGVEFLKNGLARRKSTPVPYDPADPNCYVKLAYDVVKPA